MNGEYIKAMDFDAFFEMAEPYLKEALPGELDLKKIAAMVKTRIEVFPDIAEMVDFFRELPEYDIAMYTHKKMKTDTTSSLEVLKDVLPILEAQEEYSNDALYQTLSAYVEQKGCKNGYVMWPVRTAVSGKQMTRLNIFTVHPAQFYNVKHGGRLADATVIKIIDQFLKTENLPVFLRTPAKQRNIVYYRLRHKPLIQQIFKGSMPASLCQFLVILIGN